jgi:tetratricopeptide (TPR) repeat protein
MLKWYTRGPRTVPRTFQIRAGAALVACVIAGLAAGCGESQQRGPSGSGGVELGQPLAPSTEFEKARDVPITAETHFAAAQLAESQNNTDRAVEQYRKALWKDPNHRKSMYRLGVVYSKRKQYDLAVTMWQRYIQVTGGDATAQANLGFCYELAGRGDEAEGAYLRGIRQDSRNGPCRVNYGLMLARRGRFNEAKLQLQTVLTPAEVHYNFASVYEWMGRREQAKVEYRKALELDPKMNDAQARLNAME